MAFLVTGWYCGIAQLLMFTSYESLHNSIYRETTNLKPSTMMISTTANNFRVYVTFYKEDWTRSSNIPIKGNSEFPKLQISKYWSAPGIKLLHLLFSEKNPITYLRRNFGSRIILLLFTTLKYRQSSVCSFSTDLRKNPPLCRYILTGIQIPR